MSELDHFRDKLECRWCHKRVNISTEKAIIGQTQDGFFNVYCRKCWSSVEEANDDDYLNNKFD